MSNDKKYEQMYECFMVTYEATGNVEFLKQAYNLYKEGKIIVKDVDHQFEKPAFFDKNKYGKECSRCRKSIPLDGPVWKIKDRSLNKNKYWCVFCATEEEKQNDSFFYNWNKQHEQRKESVQTIIKSEPVKFCTVDVGEDKFSMYDEDGRI